MTTLHDAPKRKAAGGYHTTTTAITKSTPTVAPGFKKIHAALKPCDRIHSGASNTMEYAGNLPDSEVFSRPESFGFGRDGLVRKAGRMAYSMLLTSRPPVARSKAASGFQSQYGAETMTNVVLSLPARKAIHTAAFPANTTPTIERQQAIQAALADALHFISTGHPGHSLSLATARTRRAMTLLKQANAEISQAVTVSDLDRIRTGTVSTPDRIRTSTVSVPDCARTSTVDCAYISTVGAESTTSGRA